MVSIPRQSDRTDARSPLGAYLSLVQLWVPCFCQFQGGSAKTTTTIYLALQGYRVIAVDLDPQASLSSLLGCIRYVITRHEPHEGPRAQIVALLRSLFGDEVFAATVLKSTAIADAGLTKHTLYEIERGQVRRSTYDRAHRSWGAVNGEILDGIRKVWGGREQKR